VLEQHQRIGNLVLDTKPPQLVLQIQRPAVINPAQAEQPEAAPTD